MGMTAQTVSEGVQYDLINAKVSKAMSPYGIGWGNLTDLVGVDGNFEGGLRPHPGFVTIHRLNVGAGDRVVFAEGFNLRLGTDSFVFGFVYRVRTAGVDRILFDWSASTAWSPTTVTALTGLSPNVQVSVTVFGQRLYILIEGRPCLRLFFRQDPNTLVITPVLLGATAPYPGPGEQPLLTSPDRAPAFNTNTALVPNNPGNAILKLLTVPPSDGTIGSQYVGVSGSGSGSTGYPQSDSAVRKFEPGDYAFAYQFINSETGDKSQISEVGGCTAFDFDAITSASGSGSGSTTVRTPLWRYFVMEVLWDTTKFDKIVFYRSVRVESQGPLSSSATMYVDAEVTLANYRWGTQPGSGVARALYYYTLEDKPLQVQNIYLDDNIFDAVVPTGGSGIVYQGSLFVSNIRSSVLVSQKPRAIGEIRWSSVTEIQPELFSPVSEYVPPTPMSPVIRFVELNGNLIGFAKDRQYHIRKESAFVRAQEIHVGYGLVNPRAVAVVGGTAYYLTTTGIKAVSAEAELDEVRVLNYLILEKWRGALDNVHFCFDPETRCLYVINPDVDTGRAVCIWFNSPKVTELWDTNFTASFQMDWPQDVFTPSSPLIRRAVFVNADGIVMIPDSRRAKKTSQRGGTTLYDLGDGTSYAKISAKSGNIITLTDLSSPSDPANWVGLHIYKLSDGTKVRVTAAGFSVGGDFQLTLASGTGFNVNDRIAISPVYVRVVGCQFPYLTANGPQINFLQACQIRGLLVNFADNDTFLPLWGVPTNPTAEDLRWRALYFDNLSETPRQTAFPKSFSGAPRQSVRQDTENIMMAAFSSDGILTRTAFLGFDCWLPDVDFVALSMVGFGTFKGTNRIAMPTVQA